MARSAPKETARHGVGRLPDPLGSPNRTRDFVQATENSQTNWCSFCGACAKPRRHAAALLHRNSERARRTRNTSLHQHMEDVAVAGTVKNRASIVQRKTGRPVQLGITDQTRTAVGDLIPKRGLSGSDFLFHSRLASSERRSTRKYARLVHDWMALIGLDPATHATHSLRRAKESMI